MSGLAAGIAGAVGVAGLASSLISHHKDAEAEKKLRDPFYKVQDEYVENRNEAAVMASGGTPDATKNYMTGELQRGLGSTVGAIGRTGGGINEASLLLDQYNRGLEGIGAQDAQQHLDNIKYFHKVNADLAGQKTMQWSINKYQPYEEKLKALKQAEATDKQNEWNSIASIGTSGVSAVTGGQNAALLKKLFAQKNQVADPYQLSSTTPPSATFNPAMAATGAQGPAAAPGSIDPNSFSSGALIQPVDSSDNS